MAKAETVRRGQLGKTELRLVKVEGRRFHGLADGKPIVDGEDADEVWRRLHDEAGRGSPRYFGYDGARTRFLHWFEDGFQSHRFLAEERDYKVAAKTKLDAAVPVEAAATGSGFGEAVLSAYRATNLLYPVEKAKTTGYVAQPGGRLLRTRSRAVYPRRDQDRALGHGGCAEAAGQRQMDRGHLPRVPVAPRAPHVPQA